MMALTAEDRLDIMELVARYSRGADNRDPDVADLFAPDGVLEANGKVLGDSSAAIRAFSEANRTSTLRRRHFVSNAVIEGDGQTATIHSYLCVYDVSDGTAKAPYLIGEYNDALVKLPEGWRFSRRVLTTVAGQSSLAKPAN